MSERWVAEFYDAEGTAITPRKPVDDEGVVCFDAFLVDTHLRGLRVIRELDGEILRRYKWDWTLPAGETVGMAGLRDKDVAAA